MTSLGSNRNDPIWRDALRTRNSQFATLTRLLVVTTFVLLNVSCVAEKKPTAEQAQVKQWNDLYPKMNSKMARMEELMNRIDRFLGSDDFKEEILGNCTEFTWLAKQSVGHANEYREGKEAEAFAEALEEVARLGGELHSSIKTDNMSEAKSILSELGSVRLKSHSNFVF